MTGWCVDSFHVNQEHNEQQPKVKRGVTTLHIPVCSSLSHFKPLKIKPLSDAGNEWTIAPPFDCNA
jgi:hypothetical protein